MIRYSQEILATLGKKYKQPQIKLQQMTLHKEIFKVIRGLYETDCNTPGEYLAGAIYGPSYLSFDYALSCHNLIPERVTAFTSASFGKNKTKEYHTDFGLFLYFNIPPDAFPFGIEILNIQDRPYAMATAEKALCDKLYRESPVNNRRELETLLYEDLRIEPSDIRNMDFCFIKKISPLYKKKNLNLLKSLEG